MGKNPTLNFWKGEFGLANIEEKVESIILEPIEKLGYDLYDVEYVKEGKDYFLRIYIQAEKEIDLNDCEKVSNEITEILDKEDPIKEQYFLEVSSTGVEKNLRKEKHLKENINNEVQIKLFKPIDGQKQYKGILKSFDNDYLILQTDKELKLDRKNISQIKTVYNW